MRGPGTVAALGILLCLGSAVGATPAEQSAANYLVFSTEPDGTARPVYTTRVVMNGPLVSLSRAEVERRVSSAPRPIDVVAVSVRDAAQHVVYRGTVNVAKWLRAEFHREGARAEDDGIDGRLLPLDPRVFVVRVPQVPESTLVLEVAQRPPATFEMDALSADPLLAPPRFDLPREGKAPAGLPANRVDLLIMGDGYAATQSSQFEADTQNLANVFFDITPYNEYRNYVNVTSFFVASAEAGADQPPYDPTCTEYARLQTCCSDPSSSGQGSVFVATAFDGTFCSYNIQRLATIDTAKVYAAAAAVPDWDEIMVLLNDPTYGGSGGSVATVSTHSLAPGVAQHEYGHSFTLLADEYSSAYPGYPPCSDITSLPDCEPNVTDETSRPDIKWTRWIAPSTPVPTVNPPAVATDAGLWEGARYLTSGMFRQGYNCLMRTLGAPFCDVASEAYALRLYEGGWGVPPLGVRTIEPGTASPPGSVTLVAGTTGTFSAQVLGPIAGPALEVVWSVDALPVSTTTAATGSTASYGYTAAGIGPHVLALRVTDRSPILHSTLRGSLAAEHSWNLTVISDVIFADGFD